MDDDVDDAYFESLKYVGNPTKQKRLVPVDCTDERRNWKKRANRFTVKHLIFGNGEQHPVLCKMIKNVPKVVPKKSQLENLFKRFPFLR